MRHRPLIITLVAALVAAGCAGSDDDATPAESTATDTDTAGDDPADGDATTDTATPATDAADPATEPADDGDETADTLDNGRSDAQDDEGDDEAESEGETANLDVAIEPSPYISLAAELVVTTDLPVAVQVTATSDDHVVQTPRTAATASEHTLPLVGMRAERTYSIDVESFDESGASIGVSSGHEFTTGSVPERVPDHPIEILDPDRMSPGYTIVEFDTLFVPEGVDWPSSQYLIAYDEEGEIVWYYENTGALGGNEPTPAGTILNFYWPFGIREIDVLGNVLNNWRPQPNETEGDEVVDELVVEGVDPDQVAFQGGLDALAGNPGDAEPTPVRVPWIDIFGIHHEAWPMPNGNVLTLSTTVHELTPEQRSTFCPDDTSEFNAVSDVAVEFEPSGRVVRTWDLWDAVDIDEIPGRELCVTTGIFAGENNRDWNHANSVTYDPERDAVIISSRHTNQIIAFDHLDEEGPQTQVRWILGDGATIPLDGEQTYYQHAVEVNPDGTLIVYDNGNFRPGDGPDGLADPPYSRAVIYEVDDSSEDPADWSARQVWEHVDTEADGALAFTTFIGDADVLENGNVLVTHGGLGTFPSTEDDPLSLLIREIVPSGDSGGDVVWELRSVDEPPTVTYRSERLPSFYFGPLWADG